MYNGGILRHYTWAPGGVIVGDFDVTAIFVASENARRATAATRPKAPTLWLLTFLAPFAFSEVQPLSDVFDRDECVVLP